MSRKSASTDCLFCRIVSREVTAHIIHEDERVIAFLDRGPIRPGHTQIVPKQHYPYFDDTPAEVLTAVVTVGQRLARVMKKTLRVPRVAFLFTGGDVAHVHAHLVPIHERTDITSRRYIVEEIVTFRGLPPASDEELSRTAGDLRRALEKKAARPRAAPAPTRKSRRIVTSTATTAGPP
jgi:histidine triad (HIT) family protein